MKKVFFDFDGTLADTSKGIINGYNYAFDKKGMPRAAENVLRENIGPPLRDVLRNLAPNESDDGINELTVLYREYYSSVGVYELEFFEGTLEMLDRISEKAQLRILSSKPTVFIENILERYGYVNYFADINGVSLGYDNKTKRERFRDSILKDGLDPADCVVVGDRAEDMGAARYCGTHFIGILYGFGDEDELHGSVTVRCVEDLKNSLMAWIDERS